MQGTKELSLRDLILGAILYSYFRLGLQLRQKKLILSGHNNYQTSKYGIHIYENGFQFDTGAAPEAVVVGGSQGARFCAGCC